MNLLNHSLADGIRRVGFRKWYERELLSSHAHMLLAFLCVIGLMASMEAFHGASALGRLLNVAFILCSLTLPGWLMANGWEFKREPGAMRRWRWQYVDTRTGSVLKISTTLFLTLLECVQDAEANGYQPGRPPTSLGAGESSKSSI